MCTRWCRGGDSNGDARAREITNGAGNAFRKGDVLKAKSIAVITSK